MKVERDGGCGELLCGNEEREKLMDEAMLMLGRLDDRQLHIVHRFIEQLLK